MHSCPYCSHDLLRQIRAKNISWYCRRCRLETDSHNKISDQLILKLALNI